MMSNSTTTAVKKYPSYRDSGDRWLGQMPEHWKVIRLRNILRSKAERDRPDLPLLSVVREKGVILRDSEDSEENHNVIPEDLSNYKVVREGQLAMNKMKAWQGSYGVSPHEGIVSPAYFTFSVTGIDGNFLHSALRSQDYVRFFTQASDGVRIGQWDLSPARMREIPVLVPPLDEQAAIVRYLDDADQRIREYVSAKERLIALLQEERQAVIHQAATRGLDSNVKLKPSGVEWLGDVPEHWDVRRLKFSYSETDERSTTGSGELMSVSHKTGVTPRKKNVTMFLAQSNEGYKVCRPGDIVVNTMWAYMAALGISRQTGLVSPSYGVYRPIRQDNLNQEYIDVLLRTETYRTAYVMLSTGITDSRLRLYADSFLGIYLLHPPVSEQAAIVRFIDKTTADIDAAIDLARGQIELTEEYRTRLIADVVTGKMDVRSHYDSAIAQEYGTEWKT